MMRNLLFSVSCLALTSAAWAQKPADPQSVLNGVRFFASAGEIAAFKKQALSERKPDQLIFSKSLVSLPPYPLNIEYKASGLPVPASVHIHRAEFFYMIEGTASAVFGGTLKDAKPSSDDNLSGSGIEGGTRRKISPGDVIFLPENTPHLLVPDAGGYVMITLHVPRGAEK